MKFNKPFHLQQNLSHIGVDKFAFLFYGEDLGAPNEYAHQVINAFKKKYQDALLVVFDSDSFKENSDCLSLEIASFSLFSPHKIIWVKNPSDELVGDIQKYLSEIAPDFPILIVTSDSFNYKSKIVKLLNESPYAFSLRAYFPKTADLKDTICQTLRDNKYNIHPDALAFLLETLGADMTATLSELNKLFIYKGDDKNIVLDDVKACFSGYIPTSTDAMVLAALSGNIQKAHQKMLLLRAENCDNVKMIRAFLNRINLLLLIQARIREGENKADVIKDTSAPPYLSASLNDLWKSLISRWSIKYLIEAQRLTIEAEKQIKSSLPANLILERYIDSLSQAGKKICRFVYR